jgi:hypothetical protein
MGGASGFFGQALQQGIDAVAGRLQTALEGVSFLGDLGHLLGQQIIGALQFLMAQQQTLDALDQGLQQGGHADILVKNPQNQAPARISLVKA